MILCILSSTKTVFLFIGISFRESAIVHTLITFHLTLLMELFVSKATQKTKFASWVKHVWFGMPFSRHPINFFRRTQYLNAMDQSVRLSVCHYSVLHKRNISLIALNFKTYFEL